FFLKRKPAYEFVRCLSFRRLPSQSMSCWPALPAGHAVRHRLPGDLARRADQIGRGSWRERREISGGAGSLKKKKKKHRRESEENWVHAGRLKTTGEYAHST